MLHKLLQSEIAMLRAVKDGSAFIQHMENFYYMTLLQVRVGISRNLSADPAADKRRTK